MNTTCHVCPICESWQVDYNAEDLASYMDLQWVDGRPIPDIKAAFGRVEHVLREHVTACMEAMALL